MCKISGEYKVYFCAGMKLGVLLVVCGVKWCLAVRLNPLDNNDKLQDINNQYVAEWQWESWPIKQEPSEQDAGSPGPRLNVALWKDSTGPAWYLFGGQPVDSESKKIYSDVWKYWVETRVWERFFPSQSEIKGAKIGGMMTLRANLFDEGNTQGSKPRGYNLVLCGGMTKTNTTKTKKTSLWNNFSRRKKLEKKKEEEPKSLAVYAPGTSKSNTVWQMDLKDKLWTAYVCCCDTGNARKQNYTLKPGKVLRNVSKTKNETETKTEKNAGGDRNESTVMDLKINKAEDEIDNEQQHLSVNNLKSKKKKINQSKNSSEKYKKVKVEKRGGESVEETNVPDAGNSFSPAVKIENGSKSETKKEGKEESRVNGTESPESDRPSNKSEKVDKLQRGKMASKYCPEFSDDGEPVTWCDGNNEVLITADISSPQTTLWIFNLKTSHWSQEQVTIAEEVEWPGCSTMTSVRFTGTEEEVFVVCSLPETASNASTDSPKNLTNLSKNPSEENSTKKSVYRINYKRRFLESLGEIRLSSYFSSPEGQGVWQNDSKSILQVVRTPENETILLLAYSDFVDLWILTKDRRGRPYFDSIEKIWRGSALKWFNKYNAAFYNLQLIAESGQSETILIPNPRTIGLGDYWPRERGRFIIRIFKNENLKNQSFENRTREQNLTYELLQSDLKPSAAETQLYHTYSLKVLVFFGISLAIFTVFGFVVFLKRCVNCPPKIRVRNECHKSPLVIRYSVIPDDLLYPVA